MRGCGNREGRRDPRGPGPRVQETPRSRSRSWRDRDRVGPGDREVLVVLHDRLDDDACSGGDAVDNGQAKLRRDLTELGCIPEDTHGIECAASRDDPVDDATGVARLEGPPDRVAG